MPDRNGNTLNPGEAVMYHHDDDTVVPATVLAEIGGRYLIQLDPKGPKDPTAAPGGLEPRTVALLDQVDAALAESRSLGGDPQEPFEVDGDRLEVGFLDEWDDEDG